MMEEEERRKFGVGLVLGLMDGEENWDVSRLSYREEDVHQDG